MKAYLYNYRQSPRKVRLVAGLIRRKNVAQALVALDFLPKRAALPMKKLLASAVANAKSSGVEVENLFVKEVMVDKGMTLKRMMPAAMGTGHRINKRTSHVALVLGEKVVAVKTTKAAKTEKVAKVKSEKKVKVAKK